MADTCIECDVAIVGSGFAGSLIAKELSQKIVLQWKRRLNVIILEAGPGVQPNINGYMRSFYKASAKVPESPIPPRSPCSIRRRRRQANGTDARRVQLEGARAKPISIRRAAPFPSRAPTSVLPAAHRTGWASHRGSCRTISA